MENPPRGNSYLKFIHANPAAPALDLYSQYYNQTNKIGVEISHKKSLPPIGYMQLQSSDNPTSSGVGTYWFHTRAAQTKDTINQPTTILLSKDKYQTLFSIDSAGTPKLLIFEDNFQKPDSGFALFRFFNANLNSGKLTLTNGTNPSNPVDFMNISNFVNVSATNHNFTVLDENGNSLQTLNLTLKNKVAYTFFFSDSLYYSQQTE